MNYSVTFAPRRASRKSFMAGCVEDVISRAELRRDKRRGAAYAARSPSAPGCAEVIEERSLAVVDVAHHLTTARALEFELRVRGFVLFGEERSGIIRVRAYRVCPISS